MYCHHHKDKGVLMTTKFKLTRVALFCSLLFISTAAVAEQIEGKVTDSSTGVPLVGANVFLKGTAIGTITDLEGKYTIASAPPGDFVLAATYIGYARFEKNIAISERRLHEDIKMVYSMVSMREVNITAQREGQVAAINQQISSDQIVNVVSQEKIQELPDANAAESIARLPGVALRRDGGEAQKVFIRGLDAKFTTITLNGIEMPATNSENREIDLSVISQDALSGIELYKALTSDLDADAIAGTVNLVSGKAREERQIRMDFTGSYNGLTKSYNQYNIVGRYSNRFFNKKLGLQASAYSEKRDRSSESFVDSWRIPANRDYRIAGLRLGFNTEKRTRNGGEITIDWDTPDKGNIKFVNIFNETSRNLFNTNKSFSAEGSMVEYDPQAIDNKIYTLNNSLIGHNMVGGFKIEWALAHAYTKNDMPFNHVLHFDETGSSKSGMKTVGSIDTLKMPGKYLIPYAWNNFSMAGLYDAVFEKNQSDERNLVAKLDIGHTFNLGRFIAGNIKAGYKFRDKTRHRDSDYWRAPYWIRYTQQYTVGDNGELVAKDWANSLWSNGWHGTLTDYLKGPPYPSKTINKDYQLYPLIDEQLVREWYNMNKNGVNAARVNYEYVYELACNRDKYTVEEMVNAGYLMTKLNFGQLVTVIAGVRYEEENNKYKAKFAPNINGFLESQFCNIIDTTATFISHQWLPNLHLRFKPLQWWDMRLAATKTLSRPDYQMRLPALVVSYHDQEIEQRNPNLKTAQAWNYDANMSFYSTKYGLLTVAGFYKEIQDIFYWLNDITILNTSQADSLGLPRKYGPYRGFVMDKPVNTDDTRVWGYEIDLQTHLGFLPGLLKNIIINANYSRIWSETYYPRFTLVTVPGKFPPTSVPKYYFTKRELYGQVDYVGNVAVGYDLGGFSGRLSVYFQGPFLEGISTFDYLDVYRKSYSRWDLVLKQQITDKIAVFMNVNNLTNIIEGNYYDFKHLDQGGVRTGVIGDLGVRLTL
jgi:TonB-dependent receptor